MAKQRATATRSGTQQRRRSDRRPTRSNDGTIGSPRPTAAGVHLLQRTYGNQALAGILQPDGRTQSPGSTLLRSAVPTPITPLRTSRPRIQRDDENDEPEQHNEPAEAPRLVTMYTFAKFEQQRLKREKAALKKRLNPQSLQEAYAELKRLRKRKPKLENHKRRTEGKLLTVESELEELNETIRSYRAQEEPPEQFAKKVRTRERLQQERNKLVQTLGDWDTELERVSTRIRVIEEQFQEHWSELQERRAQHRDDEEAPEPKQLNMTGKPLKQIKKLAKTDPALQDIDERVKQTETAIKLEKEYAWHQLTYNKVLKDYEYLRSAGGSTSMGASVKVSFGLDSDLGGVGIKAGLDVSLGISGKVATGDDYKIRPSLTFTLKTGPEFKFGTWKATASISLSYTMGETYDSLEHFAAHYMSILRTYAMGITAYRLKRLKKLRQSEKVREARQYLMEQSQNYNFEVQSLAGKFKKIEDLRQKRPGKVKAVKGQLDIGADGKVKVPGVGEMGLAGAGSVSYQHKWFTKTVSAEQYRAQNFGEKRRETPLDSLPHGLEGRVTRTFEKADDEILAGYSAGETISSMKQLTDPVLKSIDEVLHFHSWFSKTFSRKKTKTKFYNYRAHILKALIDNDWDTVAAWQKREQLENPDVDIKPEEATSGKGVKKLVKKGSVWEVSLSGDVGLGPITGKLAGKWTRIRGDANPDNDGNYINIEVGFELKVGHTIANTDLMSDSDTIEETQSAAEDTAQALSELKELRIEDGSPEGIIGSVSSILNGTSLANIPFEKIAPALLGTIALQFNLVRADDGDKKYHLQYARIVSKREMSLEGSVPVYEGISLGGEFKKSKTKALTEFLGTNTLTYIKTAYMGIMAHPNGKREWNTWVDQHKVGIWKIFKHIARGTNAAKEAPAKLRDACKQHIRDEWLNLKEDAKEMGSLSSAKRAAFRTIRKYLDGEEETDGVEGVFTEERKQRASLHRQDLAEAGWRPADEGSKRVDVPIDLSADTTVVPPVRISSPWWIVRKMKGHKDESATKEFLRMYADVADLHYSGATLDLTFHIPAHQRLDVPAKELGVVVKPSHTLPQKLAKRFAKEYSGDKWLEFPSHITGNPIGRLQQRARKRAQNVLKHIPEEERENPSNMSEVWKAGREVWKIVLPEAANKLALELESQQLAGKVAVGQ